MGCLEGKVVLVTGGGNGIGRECAIRAARNGARVLVSDFGGGADGQGAGAANPALAVVEEIKAGGGEASANLSSVTDRAAVQRLVEQALDELGGLHAVVNPAGILRDQWFHKMSEAEWSAVLDVHLNGAYNVARAAIGHFRQQQEGSIVLFTSTSGLVGAMGQSNYAAAKMGVAGLSRSIAIEGARAGVRCNAIAPFAWTRMIESVPIVSEDQRARYDRMKRLVRADQVADFVVALCSPAAADITGQLFVVRGNEIVLMSQPRPLQTVVRADDWTPEAIVRDGLGPMRAQFHDLGTTTQVFSGDFV